VLRTIAGFPESTPHCPLSDGVTSLEDHRARQRFPKSSNPGDVMAHVASVDSYAAEQGLAGPGAIRLVKIDVEGMVGAI
jgi:hypothetical protein